MGDSLVPNGLSNALDVDAQAQPPDGEFGEVEKAFGLAKGTPLSERTAFGRPRSANRRANAAMAPWSSPER